MGYLPDNGLTVWGKGDNLSADALNGNFATLKEYAERALAQALTPDAAVVALEQWLGRLEARLSVLEHMMTLTSRQRNEAEWAPLSHLAGVLQRVDGLQQTVEAAVARLNERAAHIDEIHDDQHLRLSRLEQQPEAAKAEEFRSLVAEHHDTARTAVDALDRVTGLQSEHAYTRRIAEGSDREANRREYAPLAIVAELLKRIEVLEGKP